MNPEVTDVFGGVRDLVRRRAPGLVGRVTFEQAPSVPSASEHVAISVAEGHLSIRATTVSAAAVGLARALETCCDADLSADGAPVIDIAAALPDLAPQHFATSLGTRYHLNPVAFGYTTAFWGWEQWERHIDWMALHGLNMPLHLVGHDAVLMRMLVDLGMDEADAARHVGGIAFLPWTTMGITHNLGTPLRGAALEERARLGRRIADRERELGMTVVLPGFGGQLPAELVGTDRTIDWQGWRTSLADPGSDLFAAAAASLHHHQRELLGTDHHYAVDPYIESLPPATSPQQLAEHAGAIFAGMRAADPDAVWILQGWPFHYRASYWTEPRIASLLSRVPQDRLILLDLWAEHAPMWRSTGAMWGRRWLWCLAHDFGGRFALFGDLSGLDRDLGELRRAAAEGDRGRLEGFGITAEALEGNAVVHELATRALWSPMPSLDRWRKDFVRRRYGLTSAAAQEAWDLFSRTLYGPGRTRATPSPLIARPFSGDLPFALQRRAGEPLPETTGPPSANLDAENDAQMLQALPDLARAVRRLLPLRDRDGVRDALGHDLAQLSMHVAAQSARAPLRAMATAAADGDVERIREEADVLERIIRGADAVAATRPESLLGRRLADARRCAGDDTALADALEHDARSLISVWGEQSSGLHDYSARHWSGTLTGLHLPRWRAWADWLATVATDPSAAKDPEPLQQRIRRIEEDWRSSLEPCPTEPHGDLGVQVEALLDLAEQQLPRLVAATADHGAPQPGSPHHLEEQP